MIYFNNRNGSSGLTRRLIPRLITATAIYGRWNSSLCWKGRWYPTMRFLSSCICIHTTIRGDPNDNKTYREKPRWERHKNAVCCLERILEATSHKTAAVQPTTSTLNLLAYGHPYILFSCVNWKSRTTDEIRFENLSLILPKQRRHK